MYGKIRTQLRSQRKNLSLSSFDGGLVTSLPVQKLKNNELSACTNFKISKLGGLETRQGLSKYNSTAFPDNAVSMNLANIDGTNYELFVCLDSHVYYLDSNDDPTIVSGTLNSTDVQIIGYNDVAIILDGGTIKYWDGVGDLKLAYDDGTGVNGYQFDNSDGIDSNTTTLCSGSATRVAYKFTSGTFDSGWTIDPIEVTAKLSKYGSPSGDVEVKVRKVSDDSILATKTFVEATTVTSGITAEYSTIFDSGDITTGLSTSIEYYCSIEYTGGDVSNYIDIHYTTTTNGHSSEYDGSWTDSSVKDPIISLKPGAAPKAQYGDVNNGRLFVAGDEDNYGYVWYSNLTHLDWSTPNGGGYVGAVDNSANSYAVGAIVMLYGELYIFGKEEQPYLSKLTGSSPEDYALPSLFQRISTKHKTVNSVINNLFFCSEEGVGSLRGVEQYGDLRTFTESDAIKNSIAKYWNGGAFSGYCPIDGQYWLKLDGYSRTLVCHTKQPDQQTGRLPWVEYRFFKDKLSDDTLYSWYESSTTGEFYVTTVSGAADPSILEPEYLMLNDSEVVKETLGSLVNNTWGYGDNDSLGFSTIYVSLTDMSTVSGTDISTLLEPTAFGAWSGQTFVAGDDRNVYYLDDSVVDDGDTDVRYNISTAYFIAPFAKTCLERYHADILSDVGGQLDIDLFTNNSMVTPVTTHTLTLSIADDLIVDDVSFPVDDARFNLDIGGRITEWLNVNCESFLFSFNSFIINGQPMYLNNFVCETRRVGR